MQRNIDNFSRYTYDLLVVGGGIYGACVAWEAVTRGLSVALVEKNDFGAATSANSLKIIHGGLRYLQHADFKRMRESIKERRTLLKIAPHLVHPLPILIPIYGHGVKGREAMAIALLINDLVSCDRNWQIPDSAKHIPSGRILSKSECLSRLPGLNSQGLNGGAFFFDAQVYNSERLTLAFLKSASEAGAELANYAEVTGLIKDKNQVQGAMVRDKLTDKEIKISAKLVINTAGPWIDQVKGLAQDDRISKIGALAKAVNLVVKPFIQDYAAGLQSSNIYYDQDALVKRGKRFLFTAPWRGRSMVGTWYFPYTKSPDEFGISEAELQTCLDDINSAYPLAKLSPKDISFIHCGLLPSSGISQTGEVQLTKHYSIQDHSEQGVSGLLTVSGVKYTTARDVAEKVINQAGKILGQSLPPSITQKTALYGGDVASIDHLIRECQQHCPIHLTSEAAQDLVYNYGSNLRTVFSLIDEECSNSSNLALVKAQVIYAIRQEMAHHLSDVVLRRTALGSAGKPSDPVLQFCTEVMAAELNWNSERKAAELKDLYRFYRMRQPQTSSQQVVIEA